MREGLIGLVGCSVERAQRSETGFGIDRDCDCENRIQGVRELSTDMRSSLSGYVLIVTNRHCFWPCLSVLNGIVPRVVKLVRCRSTSCDSLI